MATKCDEEFDLIKFSKGEATVWSYFNVKQHKISKKVIDNVAVCLMSLFGKKCGCNTKRAKNTTDKIARFIIKDLPLYSIVDFSSHKL